VEKGNNSIGVYGVSLGGATAIGGIAYFEKQQYVKAAVFQAAFADREQVINEYSDDFLKLPDCKLRKIMKNLVDSRYKKREKYVPKKLIQNIKCPILLIHDIEDPFMEIHHAMDLAKNVKAPLKTYFKHGVGHYNPSNKIKRYLVISFLSNYLGK
jgi:dipeptidyl aminopeptidase/acylaminoacyl peptidase